MRPRRLSRRARGMRVLEPGLVPVVALALSAGGLRTGWVPHVGIFAVAGASLRVVEVVALPRWPLHKDLVWRVEHGRRMVLLHHFVDHFFGKRMMFKGLQTAEVREGRHRGLSIRLLIEGIVLVVVLLLRRRLHLRSSFVVVARCTVVWVLRRGLPSGSGEGLRPRPLSSEAIGARQRSSLRHVGLAPFGGLWHRLLRLILLEAALRNPVALTAAMLSKGALELLHVSVERHEIVEFLSQCAV